MAFNPTMVWSLHDKVTPKLERMKKSTNLLNRAFHNTFTRGNQGLNRMVATAKGFVIGQGVVGGINKITSSVREMSREWVDFDENAFFASSKWNEVTNGTMKFNTALSQTKKISRDVGAQTRFTAGEVAASMDVMAMSGYTLAQSNDKVMLGIGQFATLARTEMAPATTMITGAMAAWGEDISQITTFGDKMVNTFTNSRMTLEELAEATKKAGSSFLKSGQDVKVFNALAMQLATVGITGEEAGTKLRNMMQVLVKKKTATTLQRIDVDVFDKQGSFRNMIDIIGDIDKALGHLSAKKKAETFRDMFNLRDINAAQVLIGGVGNSLDKFYVQQDKHANKMKTQFGLVSGSVANLGHVLKSTLTEKVFGSVESGRSPIVKFMEDTISSIRDFDMGPVNNWISENVPGMFKSITETVKELWPEIQFIALSFGRLTKTLIENSPAIIKFVDAFLKIGAVVWVGTVLIGIAGKVHFLIGALHSLAVYVPVVVGVFKTLSAIIASLIPGVLPIVVIAAAVVGAIMGISAVFKDSGVAIKNWWDEWKTLFFVLIPGIALIADLFITFARNWNSIIDTFSTDGMIAGFKAIGGTIISSFLTPLENVLEVMKHFNIISEASFNGFKKWKDSLGRGTTIDGGLIVSNNPNINTAPNQFQGLFDNSITTGKAQENNPLFATAPNAAKVQYEKQKVDVNVNLTGNTDAVDSVSSPDGANVEVTNLYGTQELI